MIQCTPPIEYVIDRNFYSQSEEERLDYIYEYQSDALELLAHLIMAEAGSDYCDDRTQYLVGSVVINRVKSDRFPDTLEEVIYQNGQYPTTSFMWNTTPTERVYEVSARLLAFGTDIPSNVVWQANFIQGEDVFEYIDTVYFCY